ncbi:hypothetical protein [Yoonia sp. 208BN28-4]|uniref:hypothetical protein n=1 Tax=Yoonia sp. 208BN28-4 TaxID=3126505 RepID=UPI0030A883E9
MTHEFSHIAVTQIAGLYATSTGGVLTWFNEGLAVIISQDSRFLPPPGGDAVCANSYDNLPVTWRDWSQAIEPPDFEIYAKSACAVSAWMEAHGGQAGVNEALTTTAQSGEFPL